MFPVAVRSSSIRKMYPETGPDDAFNAHCSGFATIERGPIRVTSVSMKAFEGTFLEGHECRATLSISQKPLYKSAWRRCVDMSLNSVILSVLEFPLHLKGDLSVSPQSAFEIQVAKLLRQLQGVRSGHELSSPIRAITKVNVPFCSVNSTYSPPLSQHSCNRRIHS
jgi:hypothetical protein